MDNFEGGSNKSKKSKKKKEVDEDAATASYMYCGCCECCECCGNEYTFCCCELSGCCIACILTSICFGVFILILIILAVANNH